MTITEKIYNHLHKNNIPYQELSTWLTSLSADFETHILLRPDSILFRGINYSIDGATYSGKNFDTELKEWNPTNTVEILISETTQEELDFLFIDEPSYLPILNPPQNHLHPSQGQRLSPMFTPIEKTAEEIIKKALKFAPNIPIHGEGPCGSITIYVDENGKVIEEYCTCKTSNIPYHTKKQKEHQS